MARTHTFKGSASAGYGYAAFIEDGQLVITEDWGREGGVLYRGPYQHAQIAMSQLRAHTPKLANSIDSYYFEEAKKISDATVKEETITHQFKNSRDLHGNGWYGYIENSKLVIGHEAPREGGILFRGTYEEAAERGWIATLLREDYRLHDDIELYFTKHGVKDESDKRATYSTGDERPVVVGYYCDPTKRTNEDFKKYGFDEATKTILFKVRLYMDNRIYHDVLVRGRFQADVIKKLMPPISEVLTLQTFAGEVFAVRSGKISAVEFLGD